MLKKIVINQISIDIDGNQNEILGIVAKKIGILQSDIYSLRILRQSVDARRKGTIQFVYSVCVELNFSDSQRVESLCNLPNVQELVEVHEEVIEYGSEQLRGRVVVVGSGPAGLFAGLELAQHGYRPLIVERGQNIQERTKKVEAFWAGGELDSESNVQFGEGGAGTFSDGKLNTRIGDSLCDRVLQEFVAAGASDEILFKAKPHLGTDVLRDVIPNIRRKIEALGGEFRFQSKLTNIHIMNGRLSSAELDSNEKFDTGALVLAIGHSARDTFEMLLSNGIEMMQKPFSVGVRIEHPQEIIDFAQYGKFAGHKALGPADYQLFTKGGERTAYTFCMCPGGVVVASDSEQGGLVTNGMSFRDRSGTNANSAFVVSVRTDDFEDKHPLAGIEFQRRIERNAFNLCKGSAPIQKLGDFAKNVQSKSLGMVKSTYARGVEYAKMDEVFPEFVVGKMREAIPEFERKLKGFALNDALLIAPETRTSSPVRILRGEDGQASGVKGIFPVGEGAGYAGGIMSAAVDGIRAARKLIAKYKADV